MSVFKAIQAVQKELAASGVGKDEQNKFDKYSYRGIDGLLNRIGPALAKHSLTIMPEVVNHTSTRVPTAKGGEQFHHFG